MLIRIPELQLGHFMLQHPAFTDVIKFWFCWNCFRCCWFNSVWSSLTFKRCTVVFNAVYFFISVWFLMPPMKFVMMGKCILEELMRLMGDQILHGCLNRPTSSIKVLLSLSMVLKPQAPIRKLQISMQNFILFCFWCIITIELLGA